MAPIEPSAAGRQESNISVAVDIGGTFTDLVAFDENTGQLHQSKQLTTHDELSQGIWNCLAKAALGPSDASTFIHGSTIAINIAIEEKGAPTALVVTRGTRDVYKIGRQSRPDAYNFFFKRPVPLAPRSRTFEIDERLSAAGEVLTPFDMDEARTIAEAVKATGAEAVAVCFLHSYKNPMHEEAMGKVLSELLEGTYISLSHQIVREYREYERTSTTVMNSYIGPKVSEYVGRIGERLSEDGFDGRFLIMQSNGGVMAPETATRLPVAMMESGPVGGVIAAAEIGQRLGYADVIAFDMGGTTAKTSLVKGGEVAVAQGYYIGGYASGHPVMYPVVDITEVGAGGGSIAWIDQVGALKLGPHSAGSMPGPVSYGRGGTEPTVTDANVVLGRIGDTSFLGGEMPLDAAAARDAIGKVIGERLGLSVVDAALGIMKIATAKMALAVRGVSVEKGYDPRDFAMVAMGGAGPLHALAIARDLHIPTVIIPNLPAHFSALGMLMADVRHDYVRTYYQRLTNSDPREIVAIYDELIGEGSLALDEADVAADARSFQRLMDLRYVGQEFHLQIPISAEEAAGDFEVVRSRFDEVHRRRFGHAADGEPVELVNLRLSAKGARRKIRFPDASATVSEACIGTRDIYLDEAGRVDHCPVYRRDLLAAGSRVSGPAVIEEYASTTVLFDGDVADIAATGEIVVKVGQK
ncbi:MAG TPA: hydantoinase/oxoprolinase family protein [Rhizobiaceae bacterium]|nr:hydantoinase/oxoprolinase family protein [Rhizobiaceae bacterium]